MDKPGFQSAPSQLLDFHWYFDSAPTKDLGITEKKIEEVHGDYIIGGIAGNLRDIVSIFNELNLKNNTAGRKFVKSQENRFLANEILTRYISTGKLAVYGTVFYHSRIPEVIRKNPDLYVDDDNPNEKGIGGLRGRAFAQTIWGIMEPLKAIPQINPVVWLDNEDIAIQNCISYHFYKQLKNTKPYARFNVQSKDQAQEGEPKGHKLSDIVCSILRNYIESPAEFPEINRVIEKTIKLDSKLEEVSFDGRVLHTNYQTRPVEKWDLSHH